MAGGLLLNKDLTNYYNFITELTIPSLTQRYELLRQLGQIFMIRSENLSMILFSSSSKQTQNNNPIIQDQQQIDFGNVTNGNNGGLNEIGEIYQRLEINLIMPYLIMRSDWNKLSKIVKEIINEK
jgi:hypothetical protein